MHLYTQHTHARRALNVANRIVSKGEKAQMKTKRASVSQCLRLCVSDASFNKNESYYNNVMMGHLHDKFFDGRFQRF